MKTRYVLWKATERCNCKCQMCSIWKKKNIKDSYPNKIYKDAWVLNITGGEPFLRNDLVEVQEKYFPNVKLIQISTNGQVKNIPQIVASFKPFVSVTISIDGSPRTHDKIRGVKGAYFNATDTYLNLLKLYMRRIGIQYTLQKENFNEAFEFLLNHPSTTFNVPMHDEFYNKGKTDNINREELINFIELVMKHQGGLRKYYYKHVIKTLKGVRSAKCLFMDGKAVFVDVDGSEKKCPYNVYCQDCTSMCESILHPIYYPFQVIKGLL